MRTGAAKPVARSLAQTSSPSMPGSTTSRITRSYGAAAAQSSASWPDPTTSTAGPSDVNAVRIAAAMASSSSTTRMRRGGLLAVWVGDVRAFSSPPQLGCRRKRRPRGNQADPVRRIEVAGGPASPVRMPVLPDDGVGPRVDDDDAVPEVVVQDDRSIGQREGETGMVEMAPTRHWSVPPEDAAVGPDPEHGARPGIVDYDDVSQAVELGVRWVADGGVDVEHDLAGLGQPDDTRAVDLGDEQAAVGEWRVAVRIGEPR